MIPIIAGIFYAVVYFIIRAYIKENKQLFDILAAVGVLAISAINGIVEPALFFILVFFAIKITEGHK